MSLADALNVAKPEKKSSGFPARVQALPEADREAVLAKLRDRHWSNPELAKLLTEKGFEATKSMVAEWRRSHADEVNA